MNIPRLRTARAYSGNSKLGDHFVSIKAFSISCSVITNTILGLRIKNNFNISRSFTRGFIAFWFQRKEFSRVGIFVLQ